ncbi:MAG TPA: response regulator, partial [Actinoplanes sp.]|nr:response regulator [Actinoplanes sp.]
MATVLIVDDRPTNLVIAHETLDLRGHEIIEAADGHDALAIAKARHPDVVVTDVMMPGIDGFQLVHELQSDPDTADIPVLLYTAHYSPAEALPLAATFGVSGVLSKAGDPIELLDAVEVALHDHPPREAAGAPTGPGFDERHLYTVNAKLMEKIDALDESSSLFAAMAQESPIGIVIGDPGGLATYVNPRLSDITRTNTADLLGQGWLRCLHNEHRRALHTGPDGSLDPALSDQRFRERLVHADGHPYWLSVLIRAIRDSEHRMTGFITMIDDISDVVEADERHHAEEREREREARSQVTARFDSLARLSGGVAHDFNNILGLILSYDEFAKDAILDATGTLLTDDSARAIISDLDKIQHAGERAARLAHQMLTFGGREVVTPTVADVNTVISDLVDTLTNTLGERVNLTTRLDPSLRAVRIDTGQLGEILTNLATNADEAMPDGGALRLETHDADPNAASHLHGLPADQYIHIAVTDNGEGMTAEVVQQAMEPFFTTRPRGQGTGLGLSTAYGI